MLAILARRLGAPHSGPHSARPGAGARPAAVAFPGRTALIGTTWQRQAARSAASRLTAPPPPPNYEQGETSPAAACSPQPTWTDNGPHVSGYPVANNLLALSWRLDDLLLHSLLHDPVRERLRRQLGVGGRWAWQYDGAEQADEEVEEGYGSFDEQQLAAEGVEEEEEEEAAQCSSSASSTRSSRGRMPQPDVASVRGTRRSGGLRQMRGRALAGTVELGGEWRSSPLPAALKGRSPNRQLTAAEEAQLGELVQAAKAAAAAAVDALEQRLQQQQKQQQQQEQGPSPATTVLAAAAPPAACPAAARQLSVPSVGQLCIVLSQGAAAWQLLNAANLRLVPYVQRSLAGAQHMPPALQEELSLAGVDALSRAVGSYQPARHTRFSTYAVAAIRNAMRDVLVLGWERCGDGGWQRRAVPTPREAQAWAAQVLHAAGRLQHAERQEQNASGTVMLDQRQRAAQASNRQQHHQHHQHHQQQQAAQEQRLARLAAAARLPPRQAAHGLAAARRQRLVGPASLVSVDSVDGACARSKGREMVPFKDVEDEEAGCGGAAQDAMHAVLAHLPPSKHRAVYRRILLRRYGLDRGQASCAEAWDLDFASLGRELGVGRQRAQQLFHAAVAEARQTAVALGLV